MEEVIGSMPTRSTKFSSGQFSSLRPCLRRSGAVCFPAGKTNWRPAAVLPLPDAN